MFLGGCIHGSLWIRNHLQYGLAILGPQKETSGVASLALLSIIVLTSLRTFRRLFKLWVVLTYMAFFVTIYYYTLYALLWIFPPFAFYGADVLLRLFRYQIKDATLTAQDTHMTLIRVHNCDDGWLAGQHVRLRVFFSNKGDSGAFVQVILDGPFGGSGVDLGLYESVFLVAGGSGVTLTLGLLDDIIGRCVKLGRSQEERTRRIESTWYILGQIEWLAPMLIDIATAASNSTIDLHISIFVACLCNPEAVPDIPNSIVTLSRPSIHNILKDLISLPPSSEKEDLIETRCQKSPSLGGGVAVCASGPESLTRDAQNAVPRLSLTMGMDMGGIALHTEQFTL
ncbi:iron reductase [Suillus plorans]|uniref:Iron reductase n=1 Tax=Suillus plorans TaxID=116603 RepID=A0A9P7AHJ5_9AGAM|nr:iron reductase [Suillus plorans]KAG1788959.1 iron reductase [Suillus plorans]